MKEKLSYFLTGIILFLLGGYSVYSAEQTILTKIIEGIVFIFAVIVTVLGFLDKKEKLEEVKEEVVEEKPKKQRKKKVNSVPEEPEYSVPEKSVQENGINEIPAEEIKPEVNK